jgi:hypothetical protein
MRARPLEGSALRVEHLGDTLEHDVGASERRRRFAFRDEADAREDARPRTVVERAERGERREACVHLGPRLVRELARSIPCAVLEVDEQDLVAGVGERVRDAATHPAGAERGDDRERHSPSSSSRSIAARSSVESPSVSSVLGPLRKSVLHTAEPSASRPRATGHGTPAHSATETRKASPYATSSRM